MMKIFRLLSLSFLFSDLLAVKVVYHFENDTVILPCDKLADQTIIWHGPVNFSIYGYGKSINPKLAQFRRLSIIHTEGSLHYNLQIRQFSSDDEGLYRCVRGESENNLNKKVFNLTMAKTPSNLTIEEEDYNHTVYGYLKRPLQLRCNVIRGSPKGTLAWIVNNETLVEGANSSLVYQFVPRQENHLQEYTCTTRNIFTRHFLKHTVRLFVYIPPIVSIIPDKHVVILEGEDLSLYCNYSSNHIIERLDWKKVFPRNNMQNIHESSQHFYIKAINRRHAGQYNCTVKNMAGINSDSVTIEVYFPPTVQIKFEEKGKERQLSCIANGIPERYIFKQWEHWSEYFELIRYISDSGSGKLNLQIIEGKTDGYQDRGIYICKASNNVSLNDGNSFIPGEFFLNPKSTPHFVTSNNRTQYGVLGHTTNITVDFVSFPEITNMSVSVDGIIHSIENYTLEIMKVLDRVHNKTVFVNGSRLMLTVKVNTENDFKAYTFKLCNQIGSENLTIYLHSASCPETPENIQIMPGNTRAIVHWTPKFNGGFQQSFHIQYRRRDVQYWDTKHVQDHTMNTYSIDGLTPGTEYLIRVYSSNRKGKSSYSDEIPFKTGATNENGNLGFILLIVPFVIAVAIVYWQYKKGRLKDLDRISCCKWPSLIDAGGIGAVENNLYENQNNDVHNAVAHNMDMPVYNSIERRAHLSIGQCVSYSATPKRKPDPLGKRKNDIACFGASSGSEKTAEWKCPDELNYIDVCFEPKPSGHKFQIHGSENKTDYVDIDFSKRICSFAESGRTSDDDFSSIDDIRMLKKEQK